MNGQLAKDAFHVGHHCDDKTCNRLDFLPVRCDGCSKNFCSDHFRYKDHHCPSGLQNDNQVPTCPLCQAPIPVKRGEIPDIRVGQHIDADCKSETALSKRKIFTNVCSATGCKKKEMMRVDCTSCRKTFCLAHRFPEDHRCQGPTSSVSRAGAAALARISIPSGASSIKFANPTAPAQALFLPKGIQANLSEDEALAMALHLSLSGGGDFSRPQKSSAQEDDDLALAQALAASEADFQSAQIPKKTNCVMS